MILQSLRLRGSIGIFEGLETEEVNVDFRQFSPGLIVLVGPNGGGKTTFGENLQPFRMLPSRPGSLARQFYLKDSCRDLLVKIGDDEYRFLIEMDPTRKVPATKSYVIKNGEHLNSDGSEEGYIKIVEELLGPEDLFFRSVFSPQKKLRWSALQPAKRKEMFLEVIGAGRLQVKCEYANKKSSEIAAEITKYHNEIEVLTRSGESIEQIDSNIALLNKSLESLRLEQIQCETDCTEASTRLSELQAKQTAQAVTESRLSQAKTQLGNLTNELSTLSSDYAKKIGQIRIVIESDQNEINRLTAACSPEAEKAIAEGSARTEEVRKDYLATVDAAQAHSELKLELSQAMNALKAGESAYGAKRSEAVGDFQKAQRENEVAKDRNQKERVRLSESLERKQRSAQILETVPCQKLPSAADCLSCQFIKDASLARNQIQVATDALADLDAAWATEFARLVAEVEQTKAAAESFVAWPQTVECKELTADVNAVNAKITALGFDEANSHNLKAELDRLEKENFAVKQQSIQTSRAKIEELTRKVTENQTRLTDIENEKTKKISEIQAQSEETDKLVKELSPQVDSIILIKLRDAGDVVKKADAAKAELSTKITRTEESLTRLNADREKVVFTAAQLTELRRRLSILQVLQADYDHLSLNLSRRGGYQALLVDHIGSLIAPQVNELLTHYGIPWTVEISTSQLAPDGKSQQEGFYITVNTPRGPRELALLSGGQEVWVDQALSDAIAYVLRQRSGRLIQTCIKDEADGSLDSGHAMDYLKAITAAHQLSGLQHTILISHREEIQQAIPQRLVFEKGKGIVAEVA